MKRLVAAIATLAILVTAAVAQGVVVQEFSFQIKDIKSWGGYTVVFNSRSYEPSGGIPDELKQNYLRLPAGATVPKVFRNKRFYCQAKKLVDQVRMDKGSGRFTPFINNLLKGKKTIPKNDKNLIKTCRFARIGTGRVLVDARPFEERPIPADLMMFWTKPAPGAVAAFAIVGIPDETRAGRAGEPDRARDRAGHQRELLQREDRRRAVRLQARAADRAGQRHPDLGRRGEGHDHRPDLHEEDEEVHAEARAASA